MLEPCASNARRRAIRADCAATLTDRTALVSAVPSPGGHFKLLHLWPGKLLQAGRFQL